jgi:uncharacterized membrane protein YozB (DUF420 family)
MQDPNYKPPGQAENVAASRTAAFRHIIVACVFMLVASVLLAFRIFLPDNPMKTPRSIGTVWVIIAIGYLLGFFRLIVAIRLIRKKR